MSSLAHLSSLKWLDAAQHVYTEYLSKPYTLETNKYDWEFTYKETKIQRPNHNLVHTLRTVSFVALVVKVYNFFNKTSISSFETENLELALLFYVVGRENESGFTDVKNYPRFRQKSADAFEKYVKQKIPQRFSEEQLQFYKRGIFDAFGNNHPQYHIICICHDLDLLRCYSRKEYDKKIQGVSKYTGALSKKLAELAEECIRNTGDRITDGGNYNGPVFVACSQSVEECMSKIDTVFQLKQAEILAQINPLNLNPSIPSVIKNASPSSNPIPAITSPPSAINPSPQKPSVTLSVSSLSSALPKI